MRNDDQKTRSRSLQDEVVLRTKDSIHVIVRLICFWREDTTWPSDHVTPLLGESRLLKRFLADLAGAFAGAAVAPAVVVYEFVKLMTTRNRRRSAEYLVAPPGSFAKRVLSFIFSKKAFDKIFAQAINDMREEHAEALANGEVGKARWIVVRDHLWLGLTVAAYLSASVVKRVVGIWNILS